MTRSGRHRRTARFHASRHSAAGRLGVTGSAASPVFLRPAMFTFQRPPQHERRQELSRGKDQRHRPRPERRPLIRDRIASQPGQQIIAADDRHRPRQHPPRGEHAQREEYRPQPGQEPRLVRAETPSRASAVRPAARLGTNCSAAWIVSSFCSGEPTSRTARPFPTPPPPRSSTPATSQKPGTCLRACAARGGAIAALPRPRSPRTR